MNCPYCGHTDSRVIDSREVSEGIRRRRECPACKKRFTTYERHQPVSLFVIKKDKRREEFSREKLAGGIRKACEKRPLPTGAIEKVVSDIESELYGLGKPEVPTSAIGDLVMAHLRRLDYIAYIRFASVYRDFTDIADMKREVDTLLTGHGEVAPGQLPLIPAEAVGANKRGRRPGR